MTVRAILLGFALATSEVIRELFHHDQPKAVIDILDSLPYPQYFYINIDEKVFALKISAVIVVANLAGYAIFRGGRGVAATRRRAASANV